MFFPVSRRVSRSLTARSPRARGRSWTRGKRFRFVGSFFWCLLRIDFCSRARLLRFYLILFSLLFSIFVLVPRARRGGRGDVDFDL
jgi:hypothetical protein